RTDRIERWTKQRDRTMLASEGIALALLDRFVVRGHRLLQRRRVNACAYAKLRPRRTAVEHRMLVEGVEKLLARPARNERRCLIEDTLIEHGPETIARLLIHGAIALAHARVILAHEALTAHVHEDLPNRTYAVI